MNRHQQTFVSKSLYSFAFNGHLAQLHSGHLSLAIEVNAFVSSSFARFFCNLRKKSAWLMPWF